MSTVQYYDFECVSYFQASIYTVLLNKNALAHQLALILPLKIDTDKNISKFVVWYGASHGLNKYTAV